MMKYFFVFVLAAVAFLITSGSRAQQQFVTLQSGATANVNGGSILIGNVAVITLTVNCNLCSGGTTVNFEATPDNSNNWVPIVASQVGTSNLATTTATAGITVWQMSVAGLAKVRARVSGYGAGTVTVTAAGTLATGLGFNFNCAANCGIIDEGSFTFGVSLGSPVNCVYQTNPLLNPLVSGTTNQGTVQCTQYRSFFTDWFNTAGTEMGTSSSPVQTQPGTSKLFSGTTSATTNASTTVAGWAGQTSKSLWITSYSCTNTSATSIYITFQDGNGGAALWTVPCPANFQGANLNGDIPMFHTTAGNALYFAASTGETTILVSAGGFAQ